ncbi:MAG: Arc family DNA-binding protein [Burkholderiales bacterium]|nr:Arc family DNA-binding protein [Burkholderiales bacterium]
MTSDLFIKSLPAVIKQLIAREAAENRRSVNQEAIALLEEALMQRIESHHLRRKSTLAALEDYAAAAARRPGDPIADDMGTPASAY